MNEEGEMRESQNSKIDIRVGGKDGRESLMSSGKIS